MAATERFDRGCSEGGNPWLQAMSLFKAAVSLIWSAVYFRAATGLFQSCSRLISELQQVYFRAAAGLLRSCSDTLRSCSGGLWLQRVSELQWFILKLQSYISLRLRRVYLAAACLFGACGVLALKLQGVSWRLQGVYSESCNVQL